MVTSSTRIAYALPALALSLVGFTFYVFLPKFYADVLGVNLTLLGVIITASRAWDAVLDPLIGTLSDGTQSRWGRRHPWLVAFTLPLGFSFLALCSPSILGLPVIWVLSLGTFLFFVFWTAVAIPYESLGADLTDNFHERTSVFAWRDGALIAGQIAAVVVPVALIGHTPSDFTTIGLLYGVVLVASVLICTWKVPISQSRRVAQSTSSILRAWTGCLSNRNFRVLLLAYTVQGLGQALPATLFLMYVEHVIQSERGPLFLLLYLVLGLALIPLWTALSRRFGKGEMWIAAMLVNTGAFVGALLLSAGDETLYGVVVVLSALGFGGTMVLPSSMQADVFDEDELINGLRREGAFIGLWAMSKKLAMALGAGTAFPILDTFGYVAGAPQRPEVITALVVLYAGVPCICNIVAVIIGWRYSLSAERHGEILKALGR